MTVKNMGMMRKVPNAVKDEAVRSTGELHNIKNCKTVPGHFLTRVWKRRDGSNLIVSISVEYTQRIYLGCADVPSRTNWIHFLPTSGFFWSGWLMEIVIGQVTAMWGKRNSVVCAVDTSADVNSYKFPDHKVQ
jgi:hypothetical protein